MEYDVSINRRELLQGGGGLFLGGLLPFLSSPLSGCMRPAGAAANGPKEAMHYEKLENREVRCSLCYRRCRVRDGARGFCRNRENRSGVYYTLVYGKPCSLQVDPIEKEPVFHMLPGTRIYCTATASCNNRCKFCHNWHISQRSVEETINWDLPPDRIPDRAARKGINSLSFTYSEPTVFYEYMYDTVKAAKARGFHTLYHTNGLINPEPLRELLEYMDAVTVDLKGFSDDFYREVCGSRLAPVLETLKNIRRSGRHLEVVNLVITDLNDDPVMIRRMCAWIRENLGAETPLHVNRYFPNYKLTHLPPTPVKNLERGWEIAKKEGLKYVYVGNTPGHEANSTLCPSCGKRIIRRTHFEVTSVRLKQGRCAFCGLRIPGIWGRTAA